MKKEQRERLVRCSIGWRNGDTSRPLGLIRRDRQSAVLVLEWAILSTQEYRPWCSWPLDLREYACTHCSYASVVRTKYSLRISIFSKFRFRFISCFSSPGSPDRMRSRAAVYLARSGSNGVLHTYIFCTPLKRAKAKPPFSPHECRTRWLADYSICALSSVCFSGDRVRDPLLSRLLWKKNLPMTEKSRVMDPQTKKNN